MMLERKIAKAKEDADRRNPAAVKNREETLRAKKKLELAQKMLDRHSADAEQSEADIARSAESTSRVRSIPEAVSSKKNSPVPRSTPNTPVIVPPTSKVSSPLDVTLSGTPPRSIAGTTTVVS